MHDTTATEAIPFDASPDQLEVAIGRLPSLGKVKVARGGGSGLERDLRLIPGNVATLTATSSLTGTHGLRRDT